MDREAMIAALMLCGFTWHIPDALIPKEKARNRLDAPRDSDIDYVYFWDDTIVNVWVGFGTASTNVTTDCDGDLDAAWAIITEWL